MSNSLQTDRIIELARSEVKRWGGTEPTLTHVAYVLVRTWPDAFTEHFGEAGRNQVEGMLRDKRFLGDEHAVRELLASASDLSAVVKELRVRLGSASALPDAAPSAVSPVAADAAPAVVDSTAVDATPTPARGTPSGGAHPQLPGPAQAKVLGSVHASTAQAVGPDRAAEPVPTGAALSERTASWLRRVRPVEREAIVRASESAEVAAHLLRPDGPIVAVIGDPGVGRTALLAEVAAQLAASRRPMPVWRMGVDTVVANPPASLGMVLDDVRTPAVIAIDDLDQLADLGTDQPDRRLLDVVNGARSHAHARLLVVLSRTRAARLGVLNQDLDEALVKVVLTPLPADAMRSVAESVATAHAEAAGLTIADGVLDAVLTAPAEGALQVHPGLAISRVDHGIGRALLVGADEVAVEHLSAGSGVRPVGVESLSIQDVLRTKVRGQDAAIEKAAERLAITRTGLDLRPHRPNGVFLFAGPTGVGKTELATQIAVAEYGSPDRLIRLDMSEYSHDWAVSRIAGPMPGYVGSTEPESWLTTRVAAMPYCVVLSRRPIPRHTSLSGSNGLYDWSRDSSTSRPT